MLWIFFCGSHTFQYSPIHVFFTYFCVYSIDSTGCVTNWVVLLFLFFSLFFLCFFHIFSSSEGWIIVCWINIFTIIMLVELSNHLLSAFNRISLFKGILSIDNLFICILLWKQNNRKNGFFIGLGNMFMYFIYY